MATPVLLTTQLLGSGGTERQMVESALMLDRSRFTPWVAYMRPGFLLETLREAGIGTLELPLRSFASPDLAVQAWRLRAHLRRLGIQLVHAFDYPMTVFAVPVARLAGVPVVLSSQRAHRDLVPSRFRRFLRWTDSRVDGIVVNCRAMREHMMHDEGVAEDRLHICYNAMRVERFPVMPRTAGSDGLTIGTVCRLRPEKNVGILLEAFANLSHPTARLLIVGDGPALPALRAQALRLGLGNRAHIEPGVPDVSNCLSQIDVFVLPSLSEAFSNSLMEAMATGAACVASDVGGNPELIEPERTGLLFPPTDRDSLCVQLDRLIRDPELRLKMGAAAAAHVRTNYSQRAIAARLMSIYDQALRSARS
jgi:L-malate glycosyltransferase